MLNWLIFLFCIYYYLQINQIFICYHKYQEDLQKQHAYGYSYGYWDLHLHHVLSYFIRFLYFNIYIDFIHIHKLTFWTLFILCSLSKSSKQLFIIHFSYFILLACDSKMIRSSTIQTIKFFTKRASKLSKRSIERKHITASSCWTPRHICSILMTICFKSIFLVFLNILFIEILFDIIKNHFFLTVSTF